MMQIQRDVMWGKSRGMTQREIAKTFNVSVSTVLKYLPASNVSHAKAHKNETVTQMRDMGCTVADIAQRTGVDRKTVMRQLATT